MKNERRKKSVQTVLLGAASVACVATTARAQVTFTVDNHAPTVSAPDAFTGTAITEGDVLTPDTGPAGTPNFPAFGAPAPPGTLITGAGLGLAGYLPCVGHAPGDPCSIEVDAMTYGVDLPFPEVVPLADTFWFSVDEFALGLPGAPAPTVFSEGAASVHMEAAGDVFTNVDMTSIPPLAPFDEPPANVGKIDGNGLPNLAGTVYPGLGLSEPSAAGGVPDDGDNLDGVDVDTAVLDGPVYFSLDSSFIDPLNGPLSGTAAFHGVSGADVMVKPLFGPATVYASAAALGLDRMGFDTDDIDALSIWENGDGVYSPSLVHYDWVPGVPILKDMLLFSVRRGSAVIGELDSKFGIPIEPGDILSTPVVPTMGGVAGNPSIFIAAENIGLRTKRSFAIAFGDDMDALDVVPFAFTDCNGNGIDDAADIGSGSSTDINMDGVPDDCQLLATTHCTCPFGTAPCGNTYAPGGCANSTGVGGLLSGTGTSSVANDDLLLTMSQLPPTQFGILFMAPGAMPFVPFGDGHLCGAGGFFRYPIVMTDALGAVTFGPIVGFANSTFPASGMITPPSSWSFQGWYRDPGGPCGSGFNLTHGLTILFTL